MTSAPYPATNPHSYRGVWPALLTPLDAALNIDHAALAAHARHLLDRGAGGVTLFGTTGEGPSFSLAERREALERLIASGIPAERILASTSCAAVTETLALSQHALDLGTHGLLILPPFFFKGVSEQGVLDSYRYVLDRLQPRADGIRVYLYHIPQVSGVGLPHGVIKELLQRYPDWIVGLKDSAGQGDDSRAYAEAFMAQMTVYVGYEPDLPALGRLGSTGAVSGLANFMPDTVRRLVQTPDADTTAAERDRVRFLIHDILAGYSLMPALKGIMALQTGNADWLRVRPPLVALTAEEQTRLANQMRAFGLDAQRD